MLTLIMGGIWFFSPIQDAEELRERLKDPAQVWPIFQQFMREGEYAKAHGLLSPAARKILPYEAFFVVFASFEAPRRMVAVTETHKVDPAGILRLCNREFGFTREIKLMKYMGKVWTLDFTPDDIEAFKGRPLEWMRLQTKRADGWHFAYPPDWTYAPLWRTCGCGK